MKSNLKGGNAIVRLLLAHGEKIGMVAILACAGMLLWSALKVPRLEDTKTPATLVDAASKAESKIQGFTWERIAEEEKAGAEAPVAILAKPIEINAMEEVSSDHFPPLPLVNPPVIPPQSPRTDPELLTALDLEVRSDAGLWATADPDAIERRKLAALAELEKQRKAEEARGARENDEEGDGRGRGRGRGDDRGREEESRPRGSTIVVRPGRGVELEGFEDIRAQSWVTVLARVPIKEQNNRYEDALQSARGFDPSRDLPKYLGYVVERAEVINSKTGPWKEIAQVQQTALIKELQNYPVRPEEVVAQSYVHPILTHPLPPLILKEWDDRVSHSSIPLASEAQAFEEEQLEEDTAEETPAETEDVDGFGVKAVPPMGGEAGGEMYGGGRGGYEGEMGGRGGGMYGGGRGGMYGGEMDGGRGGEMYGGGRGGMYGGEMDGGRGYGGALGAGRGVVLESFEWDRKTPNVLLRFFDNSVKPGHRYRYRVKLAMYDVNNGVPDKYLDKAVIARRDELKGAAKTYRFTEWSEPSPVASVPLPARLYLVNSEGPVGKAELLIKALDSGHAAEIALQEEFTRGSVINVEEKAAVIWSNSYEEEKDPEFNFITGATLVDVQGGEKIGKKNKDLVAPGRVVLMDAAGKLTIRQELKDATTVSDFKAVLEMDQDDGRGGGRGGYEGDGGERGRGGRGRGGRGF